MSDVSGENETPPSDFFLLDLVGVIGCQGGSRPKGYVQPPLPPHLLLSRNHRGSDETIMRPPASLQEEEGQGD